MTLEREEDKVNPTIGNYQENKKINHVIKKSLQGNLTIRKHRVFKTYDWEVSGQPCNQKAPNFQTSRSGIIRSTLQLESTKFSNPVIRKIQLIIVIRKDKCQPCNQEKPMSILQNHKNKKIKKHQVKSLIKLYHKKEKWEEPYH